MFRISFNLTKKFNQRPGFFIESSFLRKLIGKQNRILVNE